MLKFSTTAPDLPDPDQHSKDDIFLNDLRAIHQIFNLPP